MDPCFAECCKTCNRTCQKYKTIFSGQGDGKCSGAGTNQNVWTVTEKGKKARNKSEKEKLKCEDKAERQKKMNDFHCNCYSSKTKICERNPRVKSKQEKNVDTFENPKESWIHPATDDWGSKTSKESKSSDFPDSQNTLKENICEIEEKVDFLFRLFKDHGQKSSNDRYGEQGRAPSPGSVVVDVWQLCNLHKRMRAAEEGIEKIATILEEILKETIKKKESVFSVDDCGVPMNFEKMSVNQRISFLKNRNNLLTTFLMALLKIYTVDGIFSKPRSEEFQQKSKLDRDEILETLKKLRIQVSDFQEEVTQNYKRSENQSPCGNEQKDDHGLNSIANKLEMIFEQGKMSLNRKGEAEKVMEEITRKGNGKGKFSQMSEESERSEEKTRDPATHLLAQEAMLKSTLDEVHIELFSKLDQNSRHQTDMNNHEIVGISSELSDSHGCVFCENEKNGRTREDEFSPISGKYGRHEDFKEGQKEEEGILDLNLSGVSNKVFAGGWKKNEEFDDSKNKHSGKILRKSSFTLLQPTHKPQRTLPCIPEISSPSSGASENTSKMGDKRPMTAPTTNKNLLASRVYKSPSKYCLKNLSQGRAIKKSSPMATHIKSKNKVIAIKKSYVRAS